ncbi:MAG: calcium-binding protein [Pseudanabaena sp. RU_4_16]|nr:calcium-binding protein [Pseudanabaena sp. RU_4_16]
MAVINGSTGNDRLLGTTEADSIFGNNGDDLIDPLIGVGDYVDGGAGVDILVIDYSNLITSASFTFDRIERVILTSGGGNDSYTFNNTIDYLFGRDGNDTLDAGSLDDTLGGGNGDDRLFGGDGNDSLDGGNDNDYIIGGKGNNTLFGGAGNDVLATDNGNDYMDGGDNDDTLNGYDGQDFLVGGFGNDELMGRWGYDTVTGGAGADRFIFFSDEILNGADTITDANFAGEGDKIVANFGGLASINQFFYNSGVLSFDANLFDTVNPVVFAWVNVDSGFNFERDFILL